MEWWYEWGDPGFMREKKAVTFSRPTDALTSPARQSHTYLHPPHMQPSSSSHAPPNMRCDQAADS
eukprot:COSAG01_NODE_1384_length_10514_cov_17.435046_6_plen_65_part_00